MIAQEDVDALFKEFPNIKNDIYWSTWDSIYECRYDDPVFIKLYQKMLDLEIEFATRIAQVVVGRQLPNRCGTQ